MPTPERVEYEAVNSRVSAVEHLGLVVLEIATSQGSEVALHMRRSAFDALAAQIAEAHDDLKKRAPRA
jgi:hypothetical protein